VILILIALALAGGGLWLIFRSRSSKALVEIGCSCCLLALCVIFIAILAAGQHRAADRCRALGGVPIPAGRSDIACSNQHGGFIDPAEWR
jgi:hypothetical protein